MALSVFALIGGAILFFVSGSFQEGSRDDFGRLLGGFFEALGKLFSGAIVLIAMITLAVAFSVYYSRAKRDR